MNRSRALRIFPSLPGTRLTDFYRDASSVQLVNQWFNFTYSRSHAFRSGRNNTNSVLIRFELTTSALAGHRLNRENVFSLSQFAPERKWSRETCSIVPSRASTPIIVCALSFATTILELYLQKKTTQILKKYCQVAETIFFPD